MTAFRRFLDRLWSACSCEPPVPVGVTFLRRVNLRPLPPVWILLCTFSRSEHSSSSSGWRRSCQTLFAKIVPEFCLKQRLTWKPASEIDLHSSMNLRKMWLSGNEKNQAFPMAMNSLWIPLQQLPKRARIWDWSQIYLYIYIVIYIYI